MSRELEMTHLTSGSSVGTPSSSPGSQYGSVLLDCHLGTAHWSPEAPRRAITPDSQHAIISFPGRARHCKRLLDTKHSPTAPQPTNLYSVPSF